MSTVTRCDECGQIDGCYHHELEDADGEVHHYYFCFGCEFPGIRQALIDLGLDEETDLTTPE